MSEEKKEDAFLLPCGMIHEGEVHRNIRLEPMTGVVLKEIGRRDVRANPARIINTVLGQCLVEVEGIEAAHLKRSLNSLLVADRDYVFMKARIVTFGPKVESTLKCPSCEKKVDVTVDLEQDMTFRSLTEEDFKLEGDPPVRIFDLESSPDAREPWKARFRYPDGSDQQVIAKIQAENIFEAEQHTLWRCLVEWNGGAGPFLPKFVEHMRLDTFQDVHAAFKDAQPGLAKMAMTVCPYCSEEFAIGMGPEFLLPTSQRRRR